MLSLLLFAEIIPFHRGQRIHLPCNTSRRNYPDWYYRATHSGTRQSVYVNGLVDESFPRYSVEYPLVIKDATEGDEGIYTCKEDAGAGLVVAIYQLVYRGMGFDHMNHMFCDILDA